MLSLLLLSCSPKNAAILCGSQYFHDLRPQYLANILLVGHKVMESEVNHIRARYNCQGLQQEGAVRVIQVKNLSELQGLQKKQNRWEEVENEGKLPKKSRHQYTHWPKFTEGISKAAKLLSVIFLSLAFLFFNLYSGVCITGSSMGQTTINNTPAHVRKSQSCS